jgi:hypothetical protein
MRFFILVTAMLSGCGSNDQGSTAPAQDTATYSLMVQSVTELPACDDGRKGALAYVKAESKFYGCDGSWSVIDITGPAGPAGADGGPGPKGDVGAVGAKGDKGDTAPSNRIKSVTTCTGKLDSVNIWYSYQLVDMENSDVLVAANIRTAYIQASETWMYAADQNGALNGSAFIVYDQSGADNGGWWEFGYNRTSKVLTVTANDTDLTNDMIVFTIPAADCSVHVAAN